MLPSVKGVIAVLKFPCSDMVFLNIWVKKDKIKILLVFKELNLLQFLREGLFNILIKLQVCDAVFSLLCLFLSSFLLTAKEISTF